ncbi:MAG: TspO/MBR family protein [Nanoarchaeota archaeon]
MDIKKILNVVVCITIPLLAGFIGSFFTTSKIDTWYSTIAKPSFNPPNWIFGPVWTLLFILIGISLFLVYNSKRKDDRKFRKLKRNALIIFTIQIVLNMLWSLLFFGLESPTLGLVGIFLLITAIVANIILFYRISKPAAYLLFPYLLWVLFATVLNFAIFILN